MPSVVTANDLRSGGVVYLGHAGRWDENLVHAAVAMTPDELKLLEAEALAAIERNAVTAVYAFEVAVVDGEPQPISVRERIRSARSPSV